MVSSYWFPDKIYNKYIHSALVDSRCYFLFVSLFTWKFDFLWISNKSFLCKSRCQTGRSANSWFCKNTFILCTAKKWGNTIKKNILYFQCKHVYPISVIEIYYLSNFCFFSILFWKLINFPKLLLLANSSNYLIFPVFV